MASDWGNGTPDITPHHDMVTGGWALRPAGPHVSDHVRWQMHQRIPSSNKVTKTTISLFIKYKNFNRNSSCELCIFTLIYTNKN